MANNKSNKQQEEKETELAKLQIGAEQKFPKDYVSQLEYVTDNASSNYVKLLGVAELMQKASYEGFESSTGIKGLELYNRVIIDLVRHTKAELNEGIYDYNYLNIKDASIGILRRGQE